LPPRPGRFGPFAGLGANPDNALRSPPSKPSLADAVRQWKPPVRTVSDGVYTYHFEVFPITHRPRRFDCVYAFVPAGEVAVYIGRCEESFARMGNHHKLDRAKALGATELWICTPGPSDPLNYFQVESRLVRRFKPVLNDQLDI
jgi:hypothetical protein